MLFPHVKLPPPPPDIPIDVDPPAPPPPPPIQTALIPYTPLGTTHVKLPAFEVHSSWPAGGTNSTDGLEKRNPAIIMNRKQFLIP